jgi:bifunctional non-homologous end joining protein LigD
MAFGRGPARAVHDPLMEPLWPGRRVLVHLLAEGRPAAPAGSRGSAADLTHVRIRDEAGLELAGHPDLRSALAEAARATELVIDGYLLPLPPLAAVLSVAPPDTDVPSAAAVARHLFLGSRSRDRGRADRAAAAPTSVGRPAEASEPVALTLVAIDLLALDGETILDVPLLERKRLLEGVLVSGELVRRSPHVRLPAANWHRQWRALGFREMAVKDANGRYRPGEPSPDWTITAIPTR